MFICFKFSNKMLHKINKTKKERIEILYRKVTYNICVSLSHIREREREESDICTYKL